MSWAEFLGFVTSSQILVGYHSPVSRIWKIHHLPSKTFLVSTHSKCSFVLFSTVHIEWFPCHLHPLFPANEKNILISPVHLFISLWTSPHAYRLPLFPHWPMAAFWCLISVNALPKFSLGSVCRLSDSHWIPNACYTFVGSSPLGQLCTSNTLQW